MSILRIRAYPDQVLRRKSDPVVTVNEKIVSLLDDMIATMHYANGIGLAAPQVGVSKRVIILKNPDFNYGELLEIINPQIVAASGEITAEEGCLSIPELYTNVKRAEKITIKGLDRRGEEFCFETGSMLSRILQHEI
ncbi:MAG: peptide deformylase, partial [Nitrospinota bacterium]